MNHSKSRKNPIKEGNADCSAVPLFLSIFVIMNSASFAKNQNL